MKAKAVWIVGDRRAEVRDVDVREPQYDEILVEAKACGICAWDGYLYQGITAPGPFPYVIGHEAVGVVAKAGAGVTNLAVGNKVFCASGSNEMMAEYVTVKADCAARIPDDVTDYTQWVVEPTCCVVNLLQKAGVEPGDWVALVGAGYMGNLTLQGLTGTSPAGRISVFEIRKDRREMAKKYPGVFVFDPESDEGKAEIEAIRTYGGADVVIDFAASASGYELAGRLTSEPNGPRLGGKLVLGSWHRHEMPFDGTRWHLSGITVYNLSPMSNRHYADILPRTAALVRRGVYTPGALVTHVASYSDAEALNALFNHAADKTDGYMKGVITFGD